MASVLFVMVFSFVRRTLAAEARLDVLCIASHIVLGKAIPLFDKEV